MTITTQQLGGLAMGSGHGVMPSPIESRIKIKTIACLEFAW